jgi:hypothetical protein
MVKIVSPSGWDGLEGPHASLVKVPGSGLRGHDRGSFIKRAGASSNVFLPYLDSIKVAKDEQLVHLIALGASEAYGPNRNGDAFSEKTCQDCHDTFVKFARWYRNHKNKDPQHSYGIIKLSAYNPLMRRIELLVALNAEKSAADRNGGHVADKELAKLARGDDLAVSMACRVPYDVCSWCGNKARTRDEYCKSASCKAGGCADNLTKLVKVGNDTHLVHVKNPGPLVWFDMSDVYRPADRICYGGRADYFDKAASDGGFMGVGGAKLAEDLGVTAPLSVVLAQDALLPGEWPSHLAEQVKLAHALADVERHDVLRLHPDTRRAFAADVQPPLARNLEGVDVGEPGSVKMAAFLGALADRKIILPLRDFAALTKRAQLCDDAASCLRGAYRRMIDDGTLGRRVADNAYAPAEKLASAKVREFAGRHASIYSLHKDAVDHRIRLSALRGCRTPGLNSTIWNEKKAHDSPLAEGLARDYALYKLASLRRIAQFDEEFALTARLSACQNSVV